MYVMDYRDSRSRVYGMSLVCHAKQSSNGPANSRSHRIFVTFVPSPEGENASSDCDTASR